MKGSNNKNDISALEKENEELKKALELAMLNVAALETLVDVAEDQFNIQIRKKPGLGVPIRSTRSSFEIEPSYTFT